MWGHWLCGCCYLRTIAQVGAAPQVMRTAEHIIHPHAHCRTPCTSATRMLCSAACLPQCVNSCHEGCQPDRVARTVLRACATHLKAIWGHLGTIWAAARARSTAGRPSTALLLRAPMFPRCMLSLVVQLIEQCLFLKDETAHSPGWRRLAHVHRALLRCLELEHVVSSARPRAPLYQMPGARPYARHCCSP